MTARRARGGPDAAEGRGLPANGFRDRLAAFASLRVLVVGEAMLDGYLVGRAERISREAPVPIVALESRVDAPGGAGNTAVNVAALGARPVLASIIGDDEDGGRLRAALAERGVSGCDLIAVPGRSTLAKERVLAGDHMLVRLDRGTTGDADAEHEDRLIERLTAAWSAADAVIISDYDYGILSGRVVAAMGELARAHPRPLVVDARDPARYRRLPVTAVKPNYAEAVRLLGEPERRGPRERALQVGAAGERLLRRTGARIVAVTMDRDGVLVFERSRPPYRTYARPAADGAAAGAGDTFVAALTLALAAGAATPEAAEIASTAAAVVVGKDGTASCSLGELSRALELGGKRVEDRAELAERMDFHRGQRQRLVFTNGCFDILHRGHIAYLNRAKALGDLLVVGVNSDASVRRLKGADRPVNPLEDRMAVLEALSCVDYVVPFGEDTPAGLIDIVRPDVFAKGGDYRRETLSEAPQVEALGGTVQILPLIADRSTTRLITRVRAASAPAPKRPREGRGPRPTARRRPSTGGARRGRP